MKTFVHHRGLKEIHFHPEENELTCAFRTHDGQEFKANFGDRVKISEIMAWMMGAPSSNAFPQLSTLERSWFDDTLTEEEM